MNRALYVHIPFCDAICDYCDFVRVGYHESLVDKYLIELRKDLLKLSGPFNSIYIGGGTPSSLNLSQCKLLFDSLNHCKAEAKEITIEINPDSLTMEKALLFKEWGINRVSLGLQSTDNKQLKAIGRTHTFEDAITAVELLKQVGIVNYSLDLMYGLPHQSLHDLQVDLERICQLDPPHISLYSLTIEPNSKFARKGIKAATSELETEMYLLIENYLGQQGYQHYEISNYSKKDNQSLHNLAYWHYDDFVGIGIGAAGKEGNIRYLNASNMNDYLNNKRLYSEYLELTAEDQVFEHLMMGLRLQEGIDLSYFKQVHHIDLLTKFQDVIHKQSELGNLVILDNRLKATNQGRLMLHDVLIDFLD